MWLCPKKHEITLWRGQFPYRKIECNNCKDKEDDFGIHYESCDLILNRKYNIDDLMLSICDFCNGEVIIVRSNKLNDLPFYHQCKKCKEIYLNFVDKNQWQPKNLKNTKVK